MIIFPCRNFKLHICSVVLDSDDDSSQVASKAISLTAANGKMCQLCEQYSSEALLYLKQNETQTGILAILHHACANAAPLKQQVWNHG
jgi:hypothetical protein